MSQEMKNKSNFTVRKLVFCAMAIGLATVLSCIKIFSFPWGGSITLLSMFMAVLPGYFFGIGPGIMACLAYGALQLLIDPYVISPVQLVVDYFLAFGALGLSGLFKDAKNGLLKGYMTAVLGRYAFAVISGWIFFAEYAWEGWGIFYSLTYNGIYIFAEMALTIIVISLPPVKSAINRVKAEAEKA